MALLALHTNQKRIHLQAVVAQMQWYCRAIVCERLPQGPYLVTVLGETRTRTLHVTG